MISGQRPLWVIRVDFAPSVDVRQASIFGHVPGYLCSSITLSPVDGCKDAAQTRGPELNDIVQITAG